MRLMKTNKHSTLWVVGVLGFLPVFGQQKMVEKFDVKKEVIVNLNTSHTNVVFESWNKDVVAIEAYVDGEGLSEEQLEKVLNSWQVDANAYGNGSEINITAHKVRNKNKDTPQAITWNLNTQEGINALQSIAPMLSGMLEPILQNIAQNPIPPELQENMQGFPVHNRSGRKTNSIL